MFDLPRLDQALIRTKHRSLTVNERMPRLSGARHFSIINAKSGYQKRNLDTKLPYLTVLSCQFGHFGSSQDEV